MLVAGESSSKIALFGGVTATDPLIFAVAPVLFVAVVLLAPLLPFVAY